MKLWRVLTVLCLGLLLVVPAQASETFRIASNCGSGREAGVVVAPSPGTGDHATFVVTWKKSNLLVIGELACLIDDDLFTFGSWFADSDGALQISGGTFGDLCALFLCTAGGSDKVTVGAFFGGPDPTLDKLSGETQLPIRELMPAKASDFPGISERLGKLATVAREGRRGSKR